MSDTNHCVDPPLLLASAPFSLLAVGQPISKNMMSNPNPEKKPRPVDAAAPEGESVTRSLFRGLLWDLFFVGAAYVIAVVGAVALMLSML